VLVCVPEPYGTALDAYRRQLEDELETPAHITLLPPTTVDDGDWDAVLATLDRVAATHGPFEVRLAGTGTFRPVSPVVYVAVADGDGGCRRLEEALRSGVLESPRRFPYHPHVTIAHDLDDAGLDRASVDQAGFEATFEVTAFTLYVEVDDGWRAVADFALSG
jgi:2'-5' RNA ligase